MEQIFSASRGIDSEAMSPYKYHVQTNMEDAGDSRQKYRKEDVRITWADTICEITLADTGDMPLPGSVTTRIMSREIGWASTLSGNLPSGGFVARPYRLSREQFEALVRDIVSELRERVA